MDSTISDLKDLITAASISLSPAIAWLTFYSLWREKRRERLSSIRQRLLEVKEEMEYIGNWARAEYNEESSHDDNWHNPFWQVKDFPSRQIENFNREIFPSEVGRSLSDALVQLEAAIAQFRTLLEKHRKFLQDGFITYNQKAKDRSSSFYFLPPAKWLAELYRLNKEIHVKGIGSSINPKGLHSSWIKASKELDPAVSKLSLIKSPKFICAGHLLAGVIGVIGLGFIVAFFYEALSYIL